MAPTFPDLVYQEFSASSSAALLVSGYWTVLVGPTWDPAEEHTIWPDGCVSLSLPVGSPGARLVGPRTEALRVRLQPGLRLWGIRFRPEAGAAVCGVDGVELRDKVGLAEDYLGSYADGLANRLKACRGVPDAKTRMDDWIEGLPIPRIDPVARDAVDAIIDSLGRATTARLARASHLSERQLQRRFKRAVGLSPKQFARIRRMRTALARVLSAPHHRWSAIAAELHYADQAHLIRDVSRLTGLTPGKVTARIHRIEHLNVSP